MLYQYRIMIRDVKDITGDDITLKPADEQTADVCEVAFEDGEAIFWDACPETISIEALEFIDVIPGCTEEQPFGDTTGLVEILAREHLTMAEAFKHPVLKESDLTRQCIARRKERKSERVLED